MVEVESIGWLIELGLNDGRFDLDCRRGFQKRCPRHLTTLRVLNVLSCNYTYSCTRIRNLRAPLFLASTGEFKANVLSDQDILNDNNRPRVCERLKMLTLTFVLYSSSTTNTRTSHSMILKRISKFARLEQLDLGSESSGRIDGQELGLTLQNGLDHLRTLRCLEVYRVAL